ncbi:MAG TPA: MarR family winged helix-turn-helix transcriptional regulator [Candidatus Andersenbacteria bacterium]|nr:MarR family winged helix-turn-helix transcriptional regulator [Candidatus Andersenbacteria bacterium]
MWKRIGVFLAKNLDVCILLENLTIYIMEQLDHLITLIFGVAKQAKEYMKFAEGIALSPGQLQTLRYVQDHKNPLMKDLAGYLCVAPPSATSLIDHLAKEEYLKRVADTHDRRIVRLEITAKGKQELKKSYHIMAKHLKHVLQVLNKKETEDFITILEKLYESNN